MEETDCHTECQQSVILSDRERKVWYDITYKQILKRTYKTETDSLTEQTYGYQWGRVAERIVRD